MKLTIAEASKHSGIPDKTLYRWIANGTLSCTKDALGRKIIDIAEIERVANDRKPTINTPAENSVDSHENGTQEDVRTLENLQPAFNPPAIREESEIVNLLHSRIESLETQLANVPTNISKVRPVRRRACSGRLKITRSCCLSLKMNLGNGGRFGFLISFS